MMMADENVLHRFQRNAGADELTADTHSAIDHERRAVHHQEVARLGSADTDARAALGAQKHDSCTRLSLRLCKYGRCGQRSDAAQGQSPATWRVGHASS